VWWPPARGVVVYVHGRLAIVDRELLETMSCECYAKITSELERVRGLLQSASDFARSCTAGQIGRARCSCSREWSGAADSS
jgi:hypothetical protein